MQGQGVRAPDSNQDKVIGVELGRQDLTRPFAAKGEQESQDEPPRPAAATGVSSNGGASTFQIFSPSFFSFCSPLEKFPVPCLCWA